MFVWLNNLVNLFVNNLLGIPIHSKLGSALDFFLYDTIKIVILLGVMIFIISYIRSYFPPEKTKKIIERFSGITGNIAASLLGTVTPFCSCSSIPLFIGFVEAGIPLGVTFSFLITSPIVNEAAFVVLIVLFGIKIAAIYALSGVILGVIGGIAIGKLKMERYVEEYVYKMQTRAVEAKRLNHKERTLFALENVKEIVGRIWLFLAIGIAIGAAIHGWAPADILSRYAGPNNPFAVFAAVVAGIPLYSNAIGTIPIAEALIEKGVGMGTALSFMMAITALSLPEMVLLRKVIKPKLIGTFVVITGTGIIIIGYLFNGLIT